MTRQPEVNSAALNDAVKYNRGVVSKLDRLGAAIARDAAELAPKETGLGAKSITHEQGHDNDGPWVRVSWDRQHYYMMFHELGTSEKHARPFLRPAAEIPRPNI